MNGAVLRRTLDSGAHATGTARAKEARAFGAPVTTLSLPGGGAMSVSRGAAVSEEENT